MVELTRRERQRQATNDEIVRTARSMLRDGREVSIRAVAGEMGMTPPAMYRYVDSIAALEQLVADSIFDDVIAAMTTAAARYPDTDPAAQIVASSAAFRGWALRNPREFVPVFGTPPAQGEDRTKSNPLAHHVDDANCEIGAGDRFGKYFSDIFARLWMTAPFPVPARDELDPSFVTLHENTTLAEHTGLLNLLGDDAYGMFWTFEMAWARLYGIVTLEVFGHIPRALIDSGAMFNAQMLEIGRTVGLADQWDRLREVATAANASTID